MPDTSTPNFRIQHLRGDTNKINAYVGREGEITVNTEKRTIQVHDGVKAGGHSLSTDAVKITVLSWAADNFVLPEGVSVQKEYSNSSLKITHNKEKYPMNWFALNKESSPMVGIFPTSTRNIQVIDENTVILTNMSAFEHFDIVLHF